MVAVAVAVAAAEAEAEAVSVAAEASEIAAAGAGVVEQRHPNDGWESRERAAAVVVGHAGNCKPGCTARSQPAIAEDLRLLGLAEVLGMAGVPHSEGAAWADTVA